MTILTARVKGDRRQTVRACQILLNLVGMDGPTLWNAQGPTRRASWLKGYVRRARGAPTTTATPTPRSLPGRLAPVLGLSYPERVMLLVAFDFWNGSGGASFPDILALGPRLVDAIADLMAARLPDATADALDSWAERWTYSWPR